MFVFDMVTDFCQLFTIPYPTQKIKNDAAGRGWFSNMGAILAVKTELGMTDHELTT
jgi:hypothetical protein